MISPDDKSFRAETSTGHSLLTRLPLGWEWWAVWAALLAEIVYFGWLIRLFQLPQKSVWNDEQLTLDLLARYTPLELITELPATQPHFPVYYLALDAWLALTGRTPLDARLFSAVAGSLLIVAVAVLGALWFDRRVGLLAAAIVALNDFHVYWSGDIRMYSLYPLLAVSSFILLGRWLQHRSTGRLAAYLASVALLGYVHYFAYFVLAVHGFIIGLQWWQSRDSGLLGGWVGLSAILTPGAAVIGAKVFFWNTAGRIAGTAQPHHFADSPAGPMQTLFIVLRFGYGWLPDALTQAAVVEAVSVLVVFVGAGAGIYHGWRGKWRAPTTVLALWFVVPVLLAAVAANLTGYSIVNSRYLAGASIPLYLLFAVGVRQLDNPYGEVAAVVCAVVGSTTVTFFVNLLLAG